MKPRIVIAALAATIFLAESSHAGLLTSAQKVAGAMEEALVMEMSTLISAYGCDPMHPLSYTGTIGDTGWNVTLGGTFEGLAVNIAYTGTFDAATSTGSYASTGGVGTDTWSGIGSYSYTDTSSDSVNMGWSSQVAIKGLSTRLLDREYLIPKQWFKNPRTGYIFDRGLILFTIAGKPFTYRPEFSIRRPTLTSWASQIEIGDGAFLKGNADFSTGQVSGQVACVPEPSTMAMGLMGALAGLALGWRRLGGRVACSRLREHGPSWFEDMLTKT